MAKVNFDEVEMPSAGGYKQVGKGAQILTIVGMEDCESASGTAGINVEFHSDRFDAEFKHKFWLSKGALPRIKSMYKEFTGSDLVGAVDTEELASALVGTSSNCIVDDRAAEKVKDGKTYINYYPELRFVFANKNTPFKDEDAKTDESRLGQNLSNPLEEVPAANDADDLPF